MNEIDKKRAEILRQCATAEEAMTRLNCKNSRQVQNLKARLNRKGADDPKWIKLPVWVGGTKATIGVAPQAETGK